jgi:thiamine biosynthesis lipoprotein
MRPPAGPGRAPDTEFIVSRAADTLRVGFEALGGPCEVLADTDDPAECARLAAVVAGEARRVEWRYSRYRDDNLVHRINHAGGAPVEVDEEMAALLDYAAACHAWSDGRFDITTGALRRAWRFDGREIEPDEPAIRAALEHVGWARATWRDRTLVMPAGMEIDLGGIGKEYAVDRAVALAAGTARCAVLVNFGGDIAVTGPRRGDAPWRIGVDDPDHSGEAVLDRIELERGGLATSGDARRYVMWRGRRLGHVLDPRTGHPVAGAPRSVTVVAGTCLEAGTLATIAMLHGPLAGGFLTARGILHRIHA